MSFDAMNWAMSQAVEKSSAKFVLVAMANCVNGEGGDMVCWPSTQHLADMTAQDRKTVLDNMKRLRDAGFIEDTKERKGATGQVAVYRLKTPETGTVKTPPLPPVVQSEPPSNGTESGTGTGPKSGPVPKAVPVPKTEGNSPVFPYEQSRNSLSTVPKTGQGTSKEPGKNKEGTRKKEGFDASLIDLPEWIERDDWCRWVKDRRSRGKTITEDAAKLQMKALGQYLKDGFTPREVIENSIASGYQGLYPPKRATAQKTAGRHSGFRDVDYFEGVTNGIPDA